MIERDKDFQVDTLFNKDSLLSRPLKPHRKRNLIRNDSKIIVFIAAILLIFNMILIEYTNLLNLEEFKSFERKVARTRVFKGRDVVDKVMEESIPLSRVGGPPYL